MNKKAAIQWQTVLLIFAVIGLLFFGYIFLTSTTPGKKIISDIIDKFFVLPPEFNETEFAAPKGLTVEGAKDFDTCRTLALADKCDEAKAIAKKYQDRDIEKVKMANCWERIGDCYKRKGEDDKALNAYNKFIEVHDDKMSLERMDKKIMEIYYNKASANMKLGYIYLAHKDYEKIEKSKYEDLKNTVNEDISKINCYFYSSRAAYNHIDEAEKGNYELYESALRVLMYDTIERYSNTICAEDAKRIAFSLCKDPDIKIKIDGIDKSLCEDFETHLEKYYPKT